MNYTIMSLVVFILGLVVVYAYFVIKREFELSRYEANAKKKIDEHLRHVINSSEEVLKETESRIKQLLSQTHKFNNDIELKAKMAFDEFKNRYIDSLNSELTKVEKQYEEEFYHNINELKIALDKRLKEQMGKSDNLVDVFTKTQFENVKKELEDFKKAQEEKSVQKLQELFSKVLEDVVSKSLTIEDQKKLIWKSLESIKKQSFYNE